MHKSEIDARNLYDEAAAFYSKVNENPDAGETLRQWAYDMRQAAARNLNAVRAQVQS